MIANFKILKKKQKKQGVYFSLQTSTSIKNDFHITFETASNLNKIKLFCIFAEFQTFRISNQPDSIQNSCTFCRNDFFIENCFKKVFFDEMGVRALSGPRKRRRACPPFPQKKTFLKQFSMKNSFLQKVKEVYLEPV